MQLTGNVDAGNIILFALICAIGYLARSEYMGTLKQFKQRLEFLELWREEHDKWASAKSETLSQMTINAKGISTMIEILDKRMCRLEERELRGLKEE